jgi:short-subunit dehydrogenase
MQKILIIGATSGIGRELARLYAGAGHLVGATGRRQELLYSLQLEYPNHIVTECYDVTGNGTNGTTGHLEALVQKLDGLDLLIYNSGYGDLKDELDWQIDKPTVDVNVNGFLEAVHYGWRYFTAQGHGHLAVTSSIASIRGNRYSPAYSASKAFQSTYFEGLHIKARKMKIPLYVTDIQPGFVDTKMAKGPKFWVASAEKAARQIVRALERKKWRVYITRRWWIVAKLFKWIPDFIYHRLG